MKSITILFALVALFACMVAAGGKVNSMTPYDYFKYESAHGRGGVSCLKGKKKNGKCKRAVLRVRSAGSEDFFEIPDVEDAHVSEVEAEDAEI